MCRAMLARLLVPTLPAALILALVGATAPAARAQGIDETCVLALSKVDQGTTNALYPDDSARYYSGAFAAVPGTEIRLMGRYPHARYMSFNVYDAALRPVDALADVEFAPDPGSTNPFVVGADRTAPQRSYTGRIVFTAPPAQRERNTLYAAVGQGGAPNPTGLFTYRIYVPDKGRDEYGDVGLPTAEVVAAGSGAPVPASVCDEVRKPEVTQLNDLLAQAPNDPDAEPSSTATGRNPPHWRKFVNVASSVGMNITDNPTFNGAGQSQLDTAGGSGGFLSNRHNAYVSASTHRAFGQVLVTRLRVPTFPDTRPGTARMPDGQLRYWSLCENDLQTQRVVACLNDDRTVVGADGYANFVVSTPNERPANATAACGVNWLPWGPNPRGVLIYRHMLPAASFAESIQRAAPDREAATMGAYFPVSRYYANAPAFEGLGCARAGGASAVAPSPARPGTAPRGTSRQCASRRRFVAHVGHGALRVYLGHRRLRVHRGAVVVDLRGRPRTTVRLTIVRRHGRRLHRTYHPCVARR
jgi:hypothetical protein